MNKQPVRYLQTDPRWKALPYRVAGETATIGGSGCGPTAAAMAIETLTGRTFTPVDACKWSVDHGYKALNAGTYYSYFVPQFQAFGVPCRQLLGASLHNQPDHPVHGQVREYLAEGCYAVALMGPGTWTSGGHYILLWDWDSRVRINDPASTQDKRLNGDPDVFRREVKQYWLIDAREFNQGDDIVSYDRFKEYMERYRAELCAAGPAPWAVSHIQRCVQAGLMAGQEGGIDRPGDFLTRQEAAVIQSLALERAES